MVVFTILVLVLSTLGEAGTSGDFICGAVWVSGAMAVVFETGGLASKLVVKAGVVGFDCPMTGMMLTVLVLGFVCFSVMFH